MQSHLGNNARVNQGETNMMRKIEIELPDSIEIAGAKDAPEKFRTVKTEKWDAEFCLTAIEHGISQKLGDTWSVGKKDVDKMKSAHESLEKGDWAAKTKGVSSAKFDEAIKKLNVQSLVGKLTREQLAELAKTITPDGEVKF